MKKMVNMSPEEVIEVGEKMLEKADENCPEDGTFLFIIFGPDKKKHFKMTHNAKKGRTAKPVLEFIRNIEETFGG